MNQFRYTSYAQEVLFGPGSLERLGEAIERFGWQKLMLCTSHSVRAAGHVAEIKSILGGRLVADFDQVQPHVQDTQVEKVLSLATKKKVDAVIGMGGGSPIGMAKAVASMLEENRTGHPAQAAYPTDQPLVPVIAIPTTYAGSEMTPVFGVTHTDVTPARKVTANDPKIAPKLVIYDPNLTLDLPPELTASTGINALAHCIEALYSKTRNPLSTAAASTGVCHISHALLRCYQAANDPSTSSGEALEARTEMLLGAHLAGLSLASVSMGLHHGLCHVLGGSANIPHGIANSIILPHAIRFNAEFTAAELLPAAEAMGIPANGNNSRVVAEALGRKISDLIGQMNLPQHLRDANVDLKEGDLPNLAQLGFQNRTVQNNPRPITDVEQIEQLLKDAW